MITVFVSLVPCLALSFHADSIWNRLGLARLPRFASAPRKVDYSLLEECVALKCYPNPKAILDSSPEVAEFNKDQAVCMKPAIEECCTRNSCDEIGLKKSDLTEVAEDVKSKIYAACNLSVSEAGVVCVNSWVSVLATPLTDLTPPPPNSRLSSTVLIEVHEEFVFNTTPVAQGDDVTGGLRTPRELSLPPTITAPLPGDNQ